MVDDKAPPQPSHQVMSNQELIRLEICMFSEKKKVHNMYEQIDKKREKKRTEYI